MVSSQAARSSVDTELPGAAEKLSLATLSRGGTRCRMALTVVDRMRGLSAEDLRAREARQDQHAARRDGGIGRHAVIGLAVPGGELQHLDVGRREGDGVAERLGALALAGDMDQHGGPLGAGAGQRAGEIGHDEAVEPVRHMAQRDVRIALQRLDDARHLGERRRRADRRGRGSSAARRRGPQRL